MSRALNRHRQLGALVFHRLCALTDLSAVELCRHLEKELGRDRELQPSTLRSWRSGQVAVPVEALLVVSELVKFRFPGVELLLLGETIDDEKRRAEAYSALLSRST